MPPRKRHSILPRNTYLLQITNKENFYEIAISNSSVENTIFTRKLLENCFVENQLEIFRGYFEMSQVRFPTDHRILIYFNFSWVTLSG